MKILTGYSFMAVEIESAEVSEKTGENKTFTLANIDGTLRYMAPLSWDFEPVTEQVLDEIRENAKQFEMLAAVRYMGIDHETKPCEICGKETVKYANDGGEFKICRECGQKIQDESPDMFSELFGIELKSDKE